MGSASKPGSSAQLLLTTAYCPQDLHSHCCVSKFSAPICALFLPSWLHLPPAQVQVAFACSQWNSVFQAGCSCLMHHQPLLASSALLCISKPLRHNTLCYRPLSNTGQGRRRLNARAALRAAGQERQPQAAPVAASPYPQPTPNPTPAARQASLDMTESSSSRKSKAMAGAYSSTYSKLQAQGHLLQPSMQLALAEAAASTSQDLLPSG